MVGGLARLWPFATDDGGADAVEDADGHPEDDEHESALSEVRARVEAIEAAADDDRRDQRDRPD